MGSDRDVGEEKSWGRRLLSYVAGRDAMLAAVSSVGGSVDAMVYLRIKEVFPANMTGNTVLLGIALGRADWSTLLGAGVALAGFVAGVAAGAAIVERGREDVVWPPVVTAALALECAVLAAFAVGWRLAGEPSGGAVYLIAPVAVAMGIQSAAVRRLGVPGISATFVTGTLASLATRLVNRLRLALAPTPEPAEQEGAGRLAREKISTRDLLEPAAVLLAYGAGATVGGVAALRWGPDASLLPVALVVAVVATAAVRYRRG